MQYFKSDYMEGAHPLILERLCQTNMEKTSGYGTDEYCASARRKIAEACGCPQAEVHFMVGPIGRFDKLQKTLFACFVRMKE